MDFLSVLLQLSFYGVFAAAGWRFVRHPGRIELALVAVFSTTAALFAISLLSNFAPGLSQALRPLALTLLLAQPLLVFVLITLLRVLPRWSLLLVGAGFVVAVLSVLLPPTVTPAAALYVAGYFMLVEGAAAILLLRESWRRFGVARLRLGLASLSTALFGTALFIAGVGAAASTTGTSEPIVIVLSRVAALSAAIGYIFAFVPPRWLRNVGQRAVAFDLSRRLIIGQAGTQPGVLWRALALAAREILGARSVAIADRQGQLLADTSEHVPAPAPTRELATVSAPLVVDGVLRATLVADVEGHPLFVEDDLEVLNLLGLMTIRTIEREEAVLRLTEADRLLAESAAVRASEARFRALLEAHPSAVLAVDGGGRVTWATGPTGELFGRPADELGGIPLAELIQLEQPSADPFVGEKSEHHLETTGRRLDGTAFPADVASSDFSLDGERHQLVLVSDASWRQEANLLRDRFLGILSHELRTPITSIYGGTQLLQKKGERLDSESRDELLVGIAAESERLQRIIENLLVLARVERGADFFEPRPVVVRPVLSDLVARERPLWPEMTISLKVPRRLPLVAADEEYVSLILRNLLSNAAKYAGPGSTVEVEVRDAGPEVHFLVCDDGPGIRPEEAELLFGLYFRSANSGNAQGAGIGLFVCRGLVKAMNGRIWASQRPQGGAEFGFALPVYEDAAEASEEARFQLAADRAPAASSLEAAGPA